MGYNDSIKAVASGGYTAPAEGTYRTNNALTTPVTLNRLPGETDAAYLYRLKALQHQRELAQQKQESIIKYQKEKLLRQEQHEAQVRQENTEIAEALYKAIMANYNPNDLRSLQNAKSQIAGLKNFYTFNKLNKDFDMYSINKTGIQTDRRIFNLENGRENASYIERPEDSKNVAAFDFQPLGERNFLS